MADPKELMARYCDGDASAFRELYAAVSPKLYGYLVKMARSKALADDLLQQTFLKVHRARGAYVRGADPLPWIYSIAHRTFIDEARQGSKRAKSSTSVTGDEVPEVPAGTSTGESDRCDTEDLPVDPELLAKAALEAFVRVARPSSARPWC